MDVVFNGWPVVWQLLKDWENGGTEEIDPLNLAALSGLCWPSFQYIRSKVHCKLYFPYFVNSLAPGRSGCDFKNTFFNIVFLIGTFRFPHDNRPKMIATGLHWWYVNSGSGNGLVPSDNKPLPEPMLRQIYVAIWRHQATMGLNQNSRTVHTDYWKPQIMFHDKTK